MAAAYRKGKNHIGLNGFLPFFSSFHIKAFFSGVGLFCVTSKRRISPHLNLSLTLRIISLTFDGLIFLPFSLLSHEGLDQITGKANRIFDSLVVALLTHQSSSSLALIYS